MLRVLELFAGIGACSKALTNLAIPHTIVDAVEIDKYAIKSFNAIHGTNFEPQDIKEWDKDLKCDLIIHGSPCQDFSVAGRQAGGDEGSGTRSSLLYETLRIVKKTEPELVIWENVKNLISKRHIHNWRNYCEQIGEMGYDSRAIVMNAKDYGIPQNRERVFTISHKRGGKLIKSYRWPTPKTLELKLKDLLETEVDEKYYLTDEQIASFRASTEKQQAKGNGFKFAPLERERERGIVAHTIATRAGSRQTDNFIKESLAELRQSKDTIKSSASMALTESLQQSAQWAAETESHSSYFPIRTANKKGYDMATNGDGIDLGYPQSNTRRGRVGHGVAKTIPTSDSQGTLDGYRIRKLTPRECWRLMGFSDEDFDKAQAAGISNTQLYKQAGNSIVVDCLEAIMEGIEWQEPQI